MSRRASRHPSPHMAAELAALRDDVAVMRDYVQCAHNRIDGLNEQRHNEQFNRYCLCIGVLVGVLAYRKITGA